LNIKLGLLKRTNSKKSKIRFFCPIKEYHGFGNPPSFDDSDTFLRHLNACHHQHASKKALKRLVRAVEYAKTIGVIH